MWRGVMRRGPDGAIYKTSAWRKQSEAHAERVSLVVDGQRRETKEGEGGKPLRYLKLVKIQKKVNTCILKN